MEKIKFEASMNGHQATRILLEGATFKSVSLFDFSWGEKEGNKSFGTVEMNQGKTWLLLGNASNFVRGYILAKKGTVVRIHIKSDPHMLINFHLPDYGVGVEAVHNGSDRLSFKVR